MCECGRNEVPNVYTKCHECWAETPRYAQPENRTRHRILPTLQEPRTWETRNVKEPCKKSMRDLTSGEGRGRI